ncbi:O-antigen ligase family protein [Patescibacteria group bacterium]|nr:O-antigen ligase family protein [Patescibacteria group bacterium]
MEYSKEKSFCNLNKFLKYSLYCFALTFTLQTRWIIRPGFLHNEYFEYSTISIYVSDLLVLCLAILFGLNLLNKKDTNNKHDLNILLLVTGLGLATFLSIFFAPDKLLASYKFVLLFESITIFLILTKTSYNKFKFLYFLLTGVVLQALLGIWQFFTQSTFKNKWLGMAKHDPAELGTSVIETINQERWLRAYGSLDHPNMLGGLLSILAILLIIVILTKSSHSKLKGKTYIVVTIMLVTLFIALLLTFSRTAWIGLILGLFCLFFHLLLKSDHQKIRLLINLLLLPLIIVTTLISFKSDLILSRFNTHNRLEIKSIQERKNGYRESIEAIKIAPLFGSGIGNYSLNSSRIVKNMPAWYHQPTHNTFLLIWAEIGILGLIYFVSLFGYILWLSKNHYYIALSFPLLSILLLDHWLWSLHFGILLFWIILGTINKNTIAET